MKKIILFVIVSMGVLSSCIDHHESRRRFEEKPQLKKRVIKRIGGFVKMSILVDTIFKIGDTIEVNKTQVVILK
jgi:hypothetical protein